MKFILLSQYFMLKPPGGNSIHILRACALTAVCLGRP